MTLETFALSAAFIIALTNAIAGVWMMRYGYKLTEQQKDLLGLKETIDEGVEATKETIVQASSVVQEGLQDRADVLGADQYTQAVQVEQVQAANRAFGSAAEYVRGLAELAKNLSDLTPAVSAFIVSTILFFFAAGIATAILFVVF